MSSSPSNPTPDPDVRLLTFSGRGEQALDELVGRLVAECDGTAEGVAAVLEQIIGAEIDDLAAALVEPGAVGHESGRRLAPDENRVDETPLVESPDEAAHRRLSARAGAGRGAAPVLGRTPGDR